MDIKTHSSVLFRILVAVWKPLLILFTLKSATVAHGNSASKMSSMYAKGRDKMRWLWAVVGKPTSIWNKKHVILCPLKCEV